MAVIDISEHIFGNRNRLTEIINWLNENVGEYYGRGEDPVIRVGSGWEIVTQREYETETEEEFTIISFAVDITDPAKASHFALVWVK